MSNNLVLTGFMGTGKSSVGRALADRLDLEFVDTDALIEERHGPITEIFASQGQAAATELAQRTGLVIATGGGMLLDERNAAALDSTGVVICLTATVDELAARLLVDGERSKRPLLAGDDARHRIESLLADRSEGYGRFTQIDTTGRSIAEIVHDILQNL